MQPTNGPGPVGMAYPPEVFSFVEKVVWFELMGL
jgi:hypothetical protein